MPRIGPIRGDTSIDATTATELFDIKPIAAIIPAAASKRR